MSLLITLDITDLLDKIGSLDKIEEELAEATALLTHATYTHILEEANTKLHSRKDVFLENFPQPSQIDKDLWEITIKKAAAWIDDGIPAGFSMVEGFLNSPKAKTSKNGGKYLVIPFKHNKTPSKMSQTQKTLSDAIKQELSKKNIGWSKVEKHPNGAVKLGLISKVNIDKPEQKHKVSQGQQGPQGKPWQVHATRSPVKLELLADLMPGVLQFINMKNKAVVTGRDIMTFRTVTSKSEGWKHPGLTGMHFLDEGSKWAEHESIKILNDIFNRLGLSVGV